MRHSKRRGLALVTGAVAAALALSACSASSPTPSESTGDADFEPITDISLQLQWLLMKQVTPCSTPKGMPL